jgi:hypothetical protein
MSLLCQQQYSLTVSPLNVPIPTAYWTFDTFSGGYADSVAGINMGSIEATPTQGIGVIGSSVSKIFPTIIATVTPNILTGAQDSFGGGATYGPGSYDIYYINGALQYRTNINLLWALNDSYGSYLYSGSAIGGGFLPFFATSTEFASQAAVEAANLGAAAFVSASFSGTIGLKLSDSDYTHHGAGSPNPTFGLAVSTDYYLNTGFVPKLALKPNGWTLGVWLRLNANSFNDSWELDFYSGNNWLNLAVNYNNTSGSQALGVAMMGEAFLSYANSSVTTLSLGVWSFVTLTFSPGGHFVMTVNGVSVLDVMTGMDMFGGATGEVRFYTGGQITIDTDELGVWFSGPLTSTQTLELYNSGNGVRPPFS